jgi:hypothetical protein
MIVKCDSFTVARQQRDGGLTVEWDSVQPRPLHLGVDDIESVWQL